MESVINTDDILKVVEQALLGTPIYLYASIVTDNGCRRLKIRPRQWPESCHSNPATLAAVHTRVLQDLEREFPLTRAKVLLDAIDCEYSFVVEIPNAATQNRMARAIVYRQSMVRGLLILAVACATLGSLLIFWNTALVLLWWLRLPMANGVKDEV